MIDKMFPKLTPQKHAQIKRERPLAGLYPKGHVFGGVPESVAVGSPKSGDQEWRCSGPKAPNGSRKHCTVVASTEFLAKHAAALDLKCEPGQIEATAK